MPYTFHAVPYEGAGWADIQQIRTRVFIEEQACPIDEEFDGFDAGSHLILCRDPSGTPMATSRWRPHDAETARLERFAVLAAFRGHGVGRALVRFTIADAESAGYRRQLIHAQAHLEAFYASLGFVPTATPPFEEVGIPHVEMIRG